MKFLNALLVVLLSVVLATGVTLYVNGSRMGADNNPSRKKETRLEQIKNTGVLRCGYYNWPRFLTKDPNTGKMDGAFYDIVEEMGRQLKLKIEWTAEAATGQMFSDLAAGRFDMICGGFAETPGRAREGDFVGPIVYMPVHLFVRKDDKRFDNNYERANSPDVAFSIMDGEFSAIGAEENFPKAAKVAIPQLSTITDLYIAVAAKKADVVVEEPFSFADYDAANPGLLRVAEGGPLRIMAIGFPIPADEPALKATLDTTLAYLHDSGFIDKTLKKHEGAAKSLRVAKPYANAKEPAQ
ncbi:MAG: transporter substrate-binding domain-containing protein [Alphaproteobacteria bacterium]|nr:transporter substrate-binding domain-containing protein [Alphaproteobacteria bacterium]